MKNTRQLRLKLLICFHLFSGLIYSQKIEMYGSDKFILFDNPLNELKAKGLKDIENYCDESGTLFSIDGKSVRVASDLGSTNDIKTITLQDLNIKGLSFNSENLPQPLEVKSENGNFSAKLIQTNKDGESVLIQLIFDKNLNLLDSRSLSSFDIGEGKTFFTQSLDSTNMMFSSVKTIKSDKEYIQLELNYVVLSSDGEKIAQNNLQLENIKKNQLVDHVAQLGYSLVLFEDLTISLNYGSKIWLLDANSNKLSKINYEIEKSIIGYKYVFGEDGENYLIGGFKKGENDQEEGIAVLKLSSDKLSIDEQYYHTIDGATNSQIPWHSKKFERFGEFQHFNLIEAKIDKNGVLTAAFLGDAKDKGAGDFPSYPMNFVLIKAKGNSLVSSKIVPYTNLEAKFFGVESMNTFCIIKDDKIQLLFKDYAKHYDSQNEFQINSKKPNAQMASIMYSYDFSTKEELRKLIEFKMPVGVEYSSVWHKSNLQKINGRDNLFVARVDEWGVASLKNSYFGVFIIE